MDNSVWQQYFEEEIKEAKLLGGGLTNENYLITTVNNSYFLRVPHPDLTHLFDRHSEHQILQIVKPLSIDIPYIYFDEISGIKISPYLVNLQTYSESERTDKLHAVATILKKLHSLNTTCGKDFDYLSKLENYRLSNNCSLYNLSPYTYLETAYSKYQTEKTICHNDCVAGNLLFTEKQNYLIDYEYAGDNYPLFDVTSFTTENNLSPRLRGDFYRLYYNSIQDPLVDQIILFEKLHHYLWCYWAMMMYTVKNDNIYLEIATDKYRALHNYQIFI